MVRMAKHLGVAHPGSSRVPAGWKGCGAVHQNRGWSKYLDVLPVVLIAHEIPHTDADPAPRQPYCTDPELPASRSRLALAPHACDITSHRVCKAEHGVITGCAGGFHGVCVELITRRPRSNAENGTNSVKHAKAPNITPRHRRGTFIG